VAKIIGTAGIRLTADHKGLAAEMRVIISTALKEATAGIGAGSTKGIEDDSRRTASRIKGILSDAFGKTKNLASGFLNAVNAGQKLVLIGGAAGVALAGVSSLVTGVIGLVGVLGQAAGAVGLLPAAFEAVKAVSATLKIGLQGVGDSVKALASGDMQAFAESVKNLSPEAQKVIGPLGKFHDQIELLKKSTQDDLFRGLSKPLNNLVGFLLPQARALFNGIALSINGAAKETLAFLNTQEAQGRIVGTFGNIRGAVAALAPALKPVTSAFLDISNVGSSFLPGLAAGITSVAIQFGNFIRQSAASGQLQAFFQKALDTIKQLFQVVVQLGGGLAAVFHAANQAGGGFLNGLLQITTAFNQFVSSGTGQTALISFFSSMRDIIGQVIPVILSIAQVVASTVAPIFADLARIILPVLNSVIQQFGAALAQARPGITALAQGLATMLQVFGPTITTVVQLAGILGGVLGKVLQTLAPVLARVANAFVNGLIAIMPKLEPLILQVADAIVQLLDAAIPLIPIFLQLIVALLPILPPLIQLVAAILPPLISLIQALMPIIDAFAQIIVALLPVITLLATTILNILIPPIKLIAEVVTFVAQLVANLIQGMATVVIAILTGLGATISAIWNGIKSAISAVVSAIGSAVGAGFNAASNAVLNAMASIGRFVQDGVAAAGRFFAELPGKLLSIVGDLAGAALRAGEAIVDGIIQGIKNIAGRVADAARSVAQSAISAVTSVFKIFSPSHVMRDIFVNVGMGAIVGLEKVAPDVAAAAAGMAKGALGAITDPLSSNINLGSLNGSSIGGNGASLGGGVVLNQTNIMQPGTDVLQFSEQVRRAGAAKLSAGSTSLPVQRGPSQAGLAGAGSFFGVNGA
jgi:phage-related protein